MRHHVHLRENKDSHMEKEKVNQGDTELGLARDCRQKISRQGRTIANK